MKNKLYQPIKPEPWMQQAKCAGKQTYMFPTRRDMVEYGLKICNHCPVLNSCAAYAKRNKEEIGIWGGELLGIDGGKVDAKWRAKTKPVWRNGYIVFVNR